MSGRVLAVLGVAFIILLSFTSADAAENISEKSGAETLADSLPEDVRQSLLDIGISSPSPGELKSLSFTDVLSELADMSAKSLKTPLAILAALSGIMLLSSFLTGLRAGTFALQNVFSLCVTLCVTCVAAVPLVTVISNCVTVLKTASDFMLAYVPVMVFILSASGHAVSGSAYYAMMVFAGQAVTRVSSSVVAPLLQAVLGLSLCSSISPSVNLGGLIKLFTRFSRWVMGFVMTAFTAVLGIRQIVSAGLDNVSSRAVRFTLSSLVPVVGSALSEAFRTVQGSVGVLKSGVGVFAVIAVAAVFLPSVLNCIFWLGALRVSISLGELLSQREVCALLENISSVLSLLLGILLSVMTVYIISTATLFIFGGGA